MGFTAWFSQVGRRRHRILYLELPLWHVLADQEKIALIAHELAHGANGDPDRGLFISLAIESLERWNRLLQPRRLWVQGVGNVYHLAVLVILSGMMLCLSPLIRLNASILRRLSWHERRRAEYQADYLAALISGIAFLQAQPAVQPRVAVAQDTGLQADQELAPFREAMRQRIQARRWYE